MWENPVNRVRWSGAGSLAQVEATLEQFGHVEIQLPPDFHHALYSRIHPDDNTARIEHIDVTDGADLIRKVASVRGLHEIGSLEMTVTQTHATVHLLSPVPLIILSKPKGHARTS